MQAASVFRLAAGSIRVNGAVQSQLISGTDNKVINGLTIAVTSDPAQRPDTTGLTPVTGGSSQQFADGDKLHFVVSGSELGLESDQWRYE